MGVWRTYIAPLRSEDEFADYQDVTAYTQDSNIGKIKRKTERDDYDVGLAPNESLSLNLNNSNGQFNEPANPNSMFDYKRNGSKVKITYLFGEYEPICGFAIAGVAVLGPEIDIFEGVLTEKDITQNVVEDSITFSVLGKSSVFDELETDLTDITSENTVVEVMMILLNRIEITRLMNIDVSNFTPSLNPKLVDMNADLTLEYLSNQTIQEALASLLTATSSILYVDGSDIIVSDRKPVGDVKYSFFGQASSDGIENIKNISEYKNGFNRLFNYWKWIDTTIISKDTSSIDDYGIYKHDDMEIEIVTESAYQSSLMNTLRDEFSRPKQELTLTTFVNIEALGLSLNDKVNIDYPNVPIAMGDGTLPIWNTGTMVWQEEDTFNPELPHFAWPDALFNIEIEPNQEWKIIGMEIDSKTDLIDYELREV